MTLEMFEDTTINNQTTRKDKNMTQQIAGLKPASTGSSALDMLGQLTGDTNTAIDRLREGPVDSQTQIEELDKQLQEATSIADENLRASRIKILTADFAKIREGLDQENLDLSQAVLGLQGILGVMGKDYENLQKPTTAEQAIIDSAETALQNAKDSLVIAGQKWNVFGSRERAVASATANIETATRALEDANVQVKQMVRERLMHADIESSLQTFMNMVSKTIEIMENRMQAIIEQVKVVSARKEQAFEVKTRAAEALEKLDTELTQSEESLRVEEETLNSLVNGSSEHSAQTQKISNLRVQVEDLRGRRNTALVLFQSKERFAAELEIHEKSQMKLRDNQRSWITLLKSDTEERVITFKSRLEAMKAMADQDVAKNLTAVGVEADFKNAQVMAEIGVASDRSAIELVESQPGLIKRMAGVSAAAAEANAEVRRRFAKQIDLFRKTYGIDPSDSSFFTYNGDEDEKTAA